MVCFQFFSSSYKTLIYPNIRIYSLSVHSCFLIAIRSVVGHPSGVSNSGLPYSKPTRYLLEIRRKLTVHKGTFRYIKTGSNWVLLSPPDVTPLEYCTCCVIDEINCTVLYCAKNRCLGSRVCTDDQSYFILSVARQTLFCSLHCIQVYLRK